MVDQLLQNVVVVDMIVVDGKKLIYGKILKINVAFSITALALVTEVVIVAADVQIQENEIVVDLIHVQNHAHVHADVVIVTAKIAKNHAAVHQ